MIIMEIARVHMHKIIDNDLKVLIIDVEGRGMER